MAYGDEMFSKFIPVLDITLQGKYNLMTEFLETERLMKHSLKRIFPILLVIVVIASIVWYLFVYDRDFTRDMLLHQARLFESGGRHDIAAWLYDQAYRQSDNNEEVAIELAEQFKANGNFTKAEYTLSNAIADGGSVDLYIALCKTYIQQNKLLDAVNMLDNISDPVIKEQLEKLRPSTPEPNPAPGFYSQYITVTVKSTADTLYVSSDGEYPSVQEDAYTDGVPLAAGENVIYALAVGDNGLVSPLAVFGYTIGGVIEEVKFESSELDALVRQTLGFTAEDRILTSDLWNITTLSVPSAVTDYGDLQYFPYLTSLTIEGGSFSDLQVLANMTALQELTVTGSVVGSQDLSIIASLPALTKLTLANCSLSSIANLSGAAKLQYLDLSNNTIRDISPLSFMETLTELDLSHNALTNLSSLSSLTALTKLDVSYNSLASMAPLAGCTELTDLNISNNTIGSLTGVEELKKLAIFNAGSNALTEADILADNTALVELTLASNTLLDISSLSSLVNLQYLDFSYNEVEKLPEWETSCALVHINGSYNKLTNIDSLAGYENLNTVIVDYNKIKSVNELAKCHHLIRVDISGNPVKDVSALTEQSIIVNYTPA